MWDPNDRATFETAARRSLTPNALTALAGDLKAQAFSAPAPSRAVLAAQLAHVAFAAPDAIAETYDAACAGWLGAPPAAAPVAPLGEPPLNASEPLWQAFWSVVEDALAGRLDAAGITARTAALGAATDARYLARCARAASAYPGVAQAARDALPPRLTLATLAACPPGSLGAQFHALIVDNDFDLEVLDRDAIGLSALPAPLAWLNTRILQTHDLWHILAGYRTTGLHEIAISAFQMAQFGHPYSAQFLSVVASAAAASAPEGFGVLADTMFTAWRHGRETPPLMAIPWEEEWDDSVDVLRARHGVAPYGSPWPADLLELRGGA